MVTMQGVNAVVRRFALILALASLLTGQDIPTLALVSDPPRGTGNVRQLTYSPDGRMLAVVTTTGFQLRDAESGRLLSSIVDDVPANPRISRQFPEPWLNELCWSPDGKQIARTHGGIEIWNAPGSAPERTLPPDTADQVFYDLAWSPDGKQIAAHFDGGVVVFDMESARRTVIPEQAPNDGLAEIGGFAWSPRGDRLAIAAGYWESEVIDVWDVRKPAFLRRYKVGAEGTPPRPCGDPCLETTQTYSSKLAWAPDGSTLALNSGFSGLALWNVRTGALIRRTQNPAPITWLSWSRNSKILRIGTAHSLRFLDRDSGKAMFSSRSAESMRWVSVSPGGERRAASFDDARIDLWKGSSLQPSEHIATGAVADMGVNVSPDLHYMAGSSALGVAGVWDLQSGTKLASLKPGEYWRFAWSPDSQMLAIAPDSEPPLLRILRPSDGQAARSIPLEASNYSAYTEVSWSPDGKRVLATGHSRALVSVEDPSVQPSPSEFGTFVWNAAGDLVRLGVQTQGSFLQSPNLRYVVLRLYEKLTVWDMQENRTLYAVDFPVARQLSQVAWSPDSGRVAYVSASGVVDVWDLAASRVIEHWTAASIPKWRPFSQLTWADKLVGVDCLGGAVQLWHQP
jgi:WD40 repeat protein